MTKRAWHILGAVGAAAVLAACGEKPQTGAGVQHGAPLYQGTGSQFMAPGWKAGDAGSWQQELKARMQHGQNEYNRVR
ncbi:lipoprotein [Alicycliphilus denitrificans]|jgi:major membrane immunogen (membrane-anchored lipoprotein)|uniref:Lipoprotein n=1 Tax=Alicycliphilus denitrificans TaxID=179636 RepID=A0A3R7EYW3_9BURK|nr:hypothetical protein [Alicycliphilus denitrificans]MBN9575513.1 hypothetical protein [Alicycliphilus denitrificans]RKJ96483.1 hypothetical protein CE154_010650 [Alicycliphilus denitrificans]BCN40302.1 lipoprotein [Alicycliphilus denitrificans]